RNSKGNERLGAVLKVNGESTLFRQRIPDPQCLKWVLEPGAAPIVIRSFQVGDNKAQAFRILSRAESKAREIDYGQDVGNITLLVFPERRGKAKPPDLTDEGEDAAILSRGIFPDKKPRNIAALRQQLRDDSRRGLIVQGEAIQSSVNQLKFDADPIPLMVA